MWSRGPAGLIRSNSTNYKISLYLHCCRILHCIIHQMFCRVLYVYSERINGPRRIRSIRVGSLLGASRRSVLMDSFEHHTYLCDAVVGRFMGWIRFD